MTGRRRWRRYRTQYVFRSFCLNGFFHHFDRTRLNEFCRPFPPHLLLETKYKNYFFFSLFLSSHVRDKREITGRKKVTLIRRHSRCVDIFSGKSPIILKIEENYFFINFFFPENLLSFFFFVLSISVLFFVFLNFSRYVCSGAKVPYDINAGRCIVCFQVGHKKRKKAST